VTLSFDILKLKVNTPITTFLRNSDIIFGFVMSFCLQIKSVR